MSRSLSWIDRDELASTLTRAGVSSGAVVRSDRPTTRFTLPATNAPVATPIEAPATEISASQPQPSPPVTQTPSPAMPPPPVLDAPAVSARVAALATWLEAVVGRSFYIADAEGLPIATAGDMATLVVSSVALERAMRSLRGLTGKAFVGAVTIELETNRILETIWTSTAIGRVTVGLIGSEALPGSVVASIRQYVTRTFAKEF